MSTEYITIPYAALNMPPAPKAAVAYTELMLTNMKPNTQFSGLSTLMTAYDQDIQALKDANVKAGSKTIGAAQARASKFKALKRTAKRVRNAIQDVLDGMQNVNDAVALMVSLGLHPRAYNRPPKPELSVSMADLPDLVKLVAKAVSGAGSYYWEFSLDAKVWSKAPETMQAYTTISGLAAGQTYYFRFRALTRAGHSAYSQIVSFMVHT